MSAGNNATQGDKKSNHSWQLNVLRLLGAIDANTGGGGSGTVSAVGPTQTSVAGSIPIGAKAYSIANIGTVAGTVNGGTLPASIEVSMAAPEGTTFAAAIPYDATGTTFLVTYII